MSDERLVVWMRASEKEGGGVFFSHFRAIIDAAVGLLKQASKELAAGRDEKKEFFVVDASHNSPYKIDIACRSQDAPLLCGNGNGSIVGKVNDALRAIDREQADDLSNSMMENVGKLISPLKGKSRHSIEGLDLDFVNGEWNPHRFSAGPSFVEKFNQALARDFVCRTTVSGRAEMIDLRNDKKIRMRITCPIKGEVVCLIAPKFRRQAKNAIDSMAVIHGMGRYRPNGLHPYRVDVTEENGIEVIDFDPDAPKLSDFKGAFPDLTGGMSAEDYLREIRGKG